MATSVKTPKLPKISIEDVRAALAARPTSEDLSEARMGYGRFGCHRAYIEVFGFDHPVPAGTSFADSFAYSDSSKKTKKALIETLRSAGAKIMTLHGCGGSQGVYLGYDNCEGGKLAAQGMAAVRALKALGISCCVEAAGD